jgi:hypothetical protein
MFFRRGGSGRSPLNASGANKGTGLREIEEEEGAVNSEPEEDVGVGKLYVAVGKDLKEGRSNLLWAARNLLACDLKLVLLHVHQPAERIMTGEGIKLKIDFYLICINLWIVLLFLSHLNHLGSSLCINLHRRTNEPCPY